MKIALQVVCLLFALVSFAHFSPDKRDKQSASDRSVAEAPTGVKPTIRPKTEYFVATTVLLVLVLVIQLVWR